MSSLRVREKSENIIINTAVARVSKLLIKK